MALVRSKDTTPELRVRRFLHRSGLRFRVHPRGIPGSPDIAIRTKKIAVFVHGCFWHRHENCKRTRVPKSRLEFWNAKFNQNEQRDERVRDTLRVLGWTVVTIWECETSNEAILTGIAHSIRITSRKNAQKTAN